MYVVSAQQMCASVFTSHQQLRLHVPKFSDTRKLCCKLSKIQTKSIYPGVIPQKDANRKANSEDPDQTAPRRAV